jgi:hypothetical protein
MSLYTILIVVALVLSILAASLSWYPADSDARLHMRIKLLSAAFACYMLALLVGGAAFRIH